MPTVLLIEDEASLREILIDELESAGFNVLAPAKPADAVHLGQGVRVDVVVCDVRLITSSGPDLVRQMRLSKPALPVVFMSGADATAEVGGEPLIRKPFQIAEFLRAVRRAAGVPET